jgi:UDP-N-acetylmuramoylalanine--D-glutamate ligase
MYFSRNKKLGIVGLGVTGISCYKKLIDSAKIICFDDNKLNLENFIKIYGNENIKPIEDSSWNDLDFIILSPGIPINYPKPHPIVTIAKQNNIEIISDIDLLYLENPNKKFIAITGTNGKSTITSLIHHITKNCGLNYALCGNIGIPALSLEDNYDGYIIELSSFQLEIIKYLKLDIAIISNISPDHLDRYKDLDSYVETKMRIFDICTGEKIMKINSLVPDKYNNTDLISFSRLNQPYEFEGSRTASLFNIGAAWRSPKICMDHLKMGNGMIYKISRTTKSYNIELPENNIIILEDNLLQNKMLMENYSYAYIVSKILGLNDEEILESAKSFKPLKHRMEFVGRYENIDFYNDSKATNIDAGLQSISSLNDIFWLAGGISKNNQYDALTQYLKNIKKAYLFGQSKYEIADFLKDKLDFIICENMESAFNFALKDAILEKQANILLAPLCSSFDQFKNFEDRGDQFIEMFNKIKLK